MQQRRQSADFAKKLMLRRGLAAVMLRCDAMDPDIPVENGFESFEMGAKSPAAAYPSSVPTASATDAKPSRASSASSPSAMRAPSEIPS